MFLHNCNLKTAAFV